MRSDRPYRLLSVLPILLLTLLSACSLTRTVPPGEYLYKGADLEVAAPDSVSTKALQSELEGLLAPRTNRKILGVPVRLGLHNLFASSKEKGFFPWLQRTLGEEPILFDDNYIQPLETLLANRSFNRGYFNPTVRAEVDSSQKKARIHYLVEVEAPYTIAYYRRDIREATVRALIEELDPEELLEPGKDYNLNDLKAERERIEDHLRRHGYFYFSRDYLEFRGDSTTTQRQVGLTLELKPDLPPEALKPARVASIHVYPSFRETGVNISERSVQDSVIFHGDAFSVRARVILRAIIFRPGDLYHADYHQRTQERLINLPFYRFANVRFRPEPDADSLLRMDVFLSENLRHTIEGYLGIAHKSTHFLGPEANLTYLNRNILGGSELLRLSADANFNFPLARSLGQYYEEVEVSASLTRPGLLVPFLNQRSRKRLVRSGTTVELSMKRQRASLPLVPEDFLADEYAALLRELGFDNLAGRIDQDSSAALFVAVNEPELRFGYQWSIKRTISHFLNPVRVRLQYTTYEDPELERLLAFLSTVTQEFEVLLNLQRMLIYQPEYIFVYDGRLDGLERHNFFYRGRISYAGNTLLDSSIPEINEREIESQFIQIESDFRYFYQMRRRNMLAFRWITNFSVPLGAELILPFFDFYSVGGPNSIRAFGTREVGPGTRPPDQDGVLDILRGKGDLKLESSVEYRHRLSQLFEMAFFLDAGNVWLLQGSGPDKEQVQFDLSEFYRELAVGTGFGFRLLFSGLVIRLDFGMPLTKPWFPEGQRWLPDGIRLGDPGWRKENIVWNLAFGYPF